MTVHTFTTRLFNVLTFSFDSFSDSFLISNLRLTNITFNLEFSCKPVNDNFKMKFTHTCNYCLASFLISISLKGWIFFSKLCKCYAHLFLARFSFGFYGNINNWIWENHSFQYYWMVFITKCISGSCILKTNYSTKISCTQFFNIFSVICMHFNQSAYSFPFTLC